MKALTPIPLALLLLGSGHAVAQGFPAGGTPQLAQQVQPPSPQPQDLPPPPPEDLPPVPQEQVAVPPQQPAATGQWIFTAQYGWIWMPYGDEYVSPASSDAYAPYAYVYHPPRGWIWLAAPWINGWGVLPQFGVQSGIRHGNGHVGGGHFPGVHVAADRHRGGGGHGGSHGGRGHGGGGHRSGGHRGHR